jgi:beta-galactosidase
MRKIKDLNRNWTFIQHPEKAPVYDEEVHLPHTWNAIDGANGFDYYRGECRYSRKLYVTEQELKKEIFIEFQGANSITQVYVNGTFIGKHKGGYSTFRFRITDVLKAGRENELLVLVDNKVYEDVYPQMADFSFFGGLYRNVQLIITDQIHFDLLDFGAPGLSLFQQDVSEDKALVDVKAKIVNAWNEDKKARLWIEVLDQEDNIVAYTTKEVDLAPESMTEVDTNFEVVNPHLWHGKVDPYLYKVKASLQSYNEVKDEVVQTMGLRYFHVDVNEGFYLNGKPYRLYGVSRHQDRLDKGWAISRDDHKQDMELIEEVGANSIRLAHYQHDQYFYDLCDQKGMVVWAEIPFISVMSKTELSGKNAKQQMRELIRQNLHHASICFWGVQNEIQIGGERKEVRQVVRELNALTKEEDPTRLTTMANVMMVKDTDEYNTMTDVVGYNKYYGWYQGKTEDFATWLDEFRVNAPDIKLCISEYGAEGIIEYHNDDPQVKDYSEEYHTLFHETVWKIFKERPFLWATYVWNMFDFGANIRDEGGVQGRNNKGLITYDRRIKKDAFYMYKAQWSDEKFVHITSKRYVERHKETMDIKIYTNCDEVELIYGKHIEKTLVGESRTVIFRNLPVQSGMNKMLVRGKTDEDNVIYTDQAIFVGVSQANPSYTGPEAKGSVVANWFTLPDMEDTEAGKLEFPEDRYSIKDSVGELIENPETKVIMHRYLGKVEEQPMFGMMEGMNIELLADMDSETFSEILLFQLNSNLNKVKK